MITINGENYLSFKESAVLLGISVMTIRRWIADGKLSAHKISTRKIFIKESQVKENFVHETPRLEKLNIETSWRENEKDNLAKYKETKDAKPFAVLIDKVKRFQTRSPFLEMYDHNDVIKKFGDSPKCYLTGQDVDYLDKDSYQLDHFIPVSRGGNSELSNMKISSKAANEMKGALSYDQFIRLCGIIYNNFKENV